LLDGTDYYYFRQDLTASASGYPSASYQVQTRRWTQSGGSKAGTEGSAFFPAYDAGL
jgi:hypothetical protein